MKSLLSLIWVLTLALTLSAEVHAFQSPAAGMNRLDEMDSFEITAEQLQQMDRIYESETGLSSHLPTSTEVIWGLGQGCTQLECEVYAQIVKSEQKLYLYIHGRLAVTWPVSTGIAERETPLINAHPNGRIYEAYTSTKFPGGDFQGLGNMPYAVFIVGGIAIHGTGKANWPKLGTKASHGCIRIHPDNARYFNDLVRYNGVENIWVSVQ